MEYVLLNISLWTKEVDCSESNLEACRVWAAHQPNNTKNIQSSWPHCNNKWHKAAPAHSWDTVKEPTYEFYERFEVQKFRHLKASVIQAKEEELDEFGVSEQNRDEGGREGGRGDWFDVNNLSLVFPLPLFCVQRIPVLSFNSICGWTYYVWSNNSQSWDLKK